MPAYGAYPIADALDPGDEISSTYEGRHITLLESDLVHPAHADVFVDKGDPVVSATGRPAIVGVAFVSAAAATDRIAIDTEGIWNLDVVAVNDAGDSAVAGGDCIYINTTTAVLSKISNQATQVPFGYALGIITAGATNAIAVKVHFDQSLDNAKRTYMTVATGTYVYGKHHTSIFAGGESTGLEYFDQQVTGTQTGGIYGFGTWMELAAGFTSIAALTVAAEIGIYDAGATLTLARIVMQQIQGILASAPASLHIHRVNIAAAGGAITALYAFANPTSAGYVASAATGATKLGGIPLADIVGVGVGWVRLYDAAT
jgi:hypothetical protein